MGLAVWWWVLWFLGCFAVGFVAVFAVLGVAIRPYSCVVAVLAQHC